MQTYQQDTRIDQLPYLQRTPRLVLNYLDGEKMFSYIYASS